MCTDTHTHTLYTKSPTCTFIHTHVHTQTSNCALLKQQIIRNTLHCGRSESFLIKFRGEALYITHTHTRTHFVCFQATITSHHFCIYCPLNPLHRPAGLCPPLHDSTVDNLTATFKFILSSTLIINHSLNPARKQGLSNYSLATVTRHSRPVKLWISPHAETAHEACESDNSAKS